jgi:hypothetical protein
MRGGFNAQCSMHNINAVMFETFEVLCSEHAHPAFEN